MAYYLQIEKEQTSGVAVVWLDQPGEKVNKLSAAAVDEFKAMLDTVENDPEIKAVVLISRKPDNFVAGADLEMVLNTTAPEQAEQISRIGNQLFSRLANCPKPIVAAIHGAALGGGMELALACHYRIATDDPKTVLGLPEVKFGLLQAAGGTQRLPRLIGLQNALDMMLTGKNIYPKKARKMGLVDDVIHPYGLLQAAKTAAAALVAKPLKRKRKLSWREWLLEGNPLGRQLIYRVVAKRLAKETGGHYPAPFQVLECVRTGLSAGMAQGLATESKCFGTAVCSQVSKELIRIFFNMNKRKKNPYAQDARPLHKIGILGAGFMGTGVANVTAASDLAVLMRDVNVAALEQADKSLYQELNGKVAKGSLSPFQRDRILSRIFTQTDYHGFDKVAVVVEAVFEDLELKRKVLAETEAVIRPEAVFASNTSALPISEIAAQAKYPERVLGMHYFSPVPLMPLLEIIVTPNTAPWALATAYELGLRQGKTMIVVNDGPGFYTTRILGAYLQEAIAIFETGGDILELDRAMKRFGFPVGPMALMDEVGIDVGAHVTQSLSKYFAPRGLVASDMLVRLVQAGNKGRKNQRGFYLYQGTGKQQKKTVHTAVYDLTGGRARKAIPLSEIQQRLVLMMANEAARCLSENVLRSAEEGDVGAVFGLGFPPFLGGPFRYLDSLGLGQAVSELEALQQRYGVKFTPDPFLKEMAGKQGKFYK